MSGTRKLNLDPESFLAQHWQTRPLLINNAIDDFSSPISSHQLAGLALEDMVESRLVERCDDAWQIRHGPFCEADFQRKTPWTLLVQAVDHYIPEIAALRRLFNFIPQWRVDDVMVSYAVDGGSVGPHFDNYDVFLLQGEGERLWQLGDRCDDSSELLPHSELRILSTFEPREEYLLGPGDMLYVPPGLAHCGIARGESTTISVGFRAPRIMDMVSRWVDQLLEELEPDQFYHDDGREVTGRPGEIPAADVQRALMQLQTALGQTVSPHWFGELVTEPREQPVQAIDDLAEARATLAGNAQFVELSPTAKLAWQEVPGGILVFANGECREFDASVLPCLLALCGDWRLDTAGIASARCEPGGAKLLDYLMESGVIYVN